MSSELNENTDFEAKVESLQEYASTKVEIFLQPMMQALFASRPDDPVDFMIQYLTEYRDQQNEQDNGLNTDDGDVFAAEEHSEMHALPVIEVDRSKPHARRTRRAAVSAEPVDELEDSKHVVRIVEKDASDAERIRKAVSNNILFNSLDDDEMQVVVDAMLPMEFSPGDAIIKQGDTGDNFYVLAQGECECFVNRPNDSPLMVKLYTFGESFGELALMYNCPRAASIIAKTPVKVWAVDRVTFRRTLMQATRGKRQKYEEFLGRVPILDKLDKYERASIADALVEIKFDDGECIIAEGDAGNSLYIIKKGAAKATKVLPGDPNPQVVKEYADGDYFGELALLNDRPRAANVIAVGKTTCVFIDRDSFSRLLGPCTDIMKRNTVAYDEADKKITENNIARLKAHVRSQSQSSDTTAMPSSESKEELTLVRYKRDRRGAVCAEPITEESLKGFERVVIPKTNRQKSDIRQAVSSNVLFSSLDSEQLKIVIDAMFEKNFTPGDVIIQQGDDGDAFYVLDAGVAECFVARDGKSTMVKTYMHGESFGELALMYNCPRAASIIAKTDCSVWGMDRMTFRAVIMNDAKQKRDMYDDFLSKVNLLESLDDYERHKIADALVPVEFKDGDYIIRQGENGDCFYFLERGEAAAKKKLIGDNETEVYRYNTPGQFFGELALLTDQPRAANVVAVGDCKCVKLDRDAFVRLLGPVEDILKRNQTHYEEIEQRLLSQ
jgi:cAMP-dependent protein kinase regulator